MKLKDPHVFLEFIPTSFTLEGTLGYLSAAKFEFKPGGKVDQQVFEACFMYHSSLGTIGHPYLETIAASGFPAKPEPVAEALQRLQEWAGEEWSVTEVWSLAAPFFYPMFFNLCAKMGIEPFITPERMHSIETLSVIMPNNEWLKFRKQPMKVGAENIVERVSTLQSLLGFQEMLH